MWHVQTVSCPRLKKTVSLANAPRWQTLFSNSKMGIQLVKLVSITDISTSYKPVVSMGDLQDPTHGGTLVP